MKALCVLILLLNCPPLAADPVAQSSPEALAGEDGAVPTALPTPEADEGGPAMVSRTQQAAPSFALPAFVVTSGGERQDLVQRGDLGSALDTSGGIKASPGEAGAGQDQRATEAVRAAAQDETFTPTPRYGELTASYGTGNTLNLDGLLAGEQGPWYGWLAGGTHFSDGGPLPGSALEPAQRHDAGLSGQGGWRRDPDDLFEAAADGAWRSLRLTSFPGDAWLQRSQGGASGAWDGQGLGLTQRVEVRGSEAQFDLPHASYSEGGGGVDATAEKSLNTSRGGVLLDGGLDLGVLDQRGGTVDRAIWTGRLRFEGHFEPWSGSRLGLGVQADGDAGGASAFQWGPRLDFEQRLSRDLGLRLEYGTGLDLSRLGGAEFEEDPLLPNPALRPSRRIADLKAEVPWAVGSGLSLEAGGFVRQDVNAFLPGTAPEAGLWTDTEVGTLRMEGLKADERYELGPWWQSLDALGQRAALEDDGGLSPTFIPPWKAELGLGWKRGPWSAETRLKAQGQRQASLRGGWVIPPQWDLELRATYAVSDSLSLFVEGDSLAGAVIDWPGYTDASPYLGLGAKLRF